MRWAAFADLLCFCLNEVDWRSICGRFSINLASMRIRFGVDARSNWDQCRVHTDRCWVDAASLQGQIAIDAMSAGSPKPIYWARCAVFVNREDGADTVNCAAIALNTTPSEPAGTTTGTRPMYTMPSCARLKGPPARTSTIATPSIVREFVS